eukprot:7096215-Heterocapsa_arctica.AAC.1
MMFSTAAAVSPESFPSSSEEASSASSAVTAVGFPESSPGSTEEVSSALELPLQLGFPGLLQARRKRSRRASRAAAAGFP